MPQCHLSGGNDEANVLTEFYSHAQKLRELEEVFVDELQLLARKVISKKPDFQKNLDTTLKHTMQTSFTITIAH